MTIHCPTCGGSYRRAKNGEGAISADKIIAPHCDHIAVLKALMSSVSNKNYTTQELYKMTVDIRPITFGAFQRAESDLVRKKAIIPNGKSKIILTDDGAFRTVPRPVYIIDIERVKNILDTGLF